MEAIRNLYQNLTKSEEAAILAGRTLVLGEGAQKANLCMIGEAPGAEEEQAGRPFVGKAGKNLMSFLQALGLTREAVYITNVVKVRPTKPSAKTGKPINRPPSKEELACFVPYLHEELALLAPKVIVTLGNVPLQAVLGDAKALIGAYHGVPTRLADGRVLFALYHPAAIIYNRALKEVYDADVAALAEYLQKERIS